MTDQTEAVARAIYAAEREASPRSWPFEQMPEIGKDRYRALARAAIAALPPVRPVVRALEWEDHPRDDGAVMSKATALHGTYFICDDTDDFSGLYLQLISHDDARWWQHVRSTCETLMENVHDGNLAPMKAAAQADYEARILAAIEPAPVSAREAARVLLDQPYEAMKKAFYAMDSKQGEGADRIMAAALRAIAEGED